MPRKIKATNITKTGKESKSKKVKAGDCQFPFIHKGKLHNKCVDGENGKWCATEVNKGRQMVKFGFCPDKSKSKSKSPSLSNSPPKTKRKHKQSKIRNKNQNKYRP